MELSILDKLREQSTSRLITTNNREYKYKMNTQLSHIQCKLLSLSTTSTITKSSNKYSRGKQIAGLLYVCSLVDI